MEYSKDGTTKRVIVTQNNQQPFDVRYDDGFLNPQLSPDGKYIVYEASSSISPFDMYVVERQTGKLAAQLFENKPGFESPNWTPDGRIVFSGKASGSKPGIYITSKDFSTYERIDKDLSNPSQARVSPDGTKIAFILNKHLYTMNIDGTDVKQITTSDWNESQPTWSPDGQWIAVYGNTSILLIPLNKDGYVDLDDINDNFITFTADERGQFQWVY